MKLVFVHGWGCHAGVWDKLLPLLPGHEHVIIDLGFVRGGPKGAGSMPEDAVCIGHSFGVLWLLKHGPRPMRGLVSVAGFDCFYKYLPEDVLPTMMAGLESDPLAQMRHFWKKCGMGDGPDGDIDAGALRAGLEWLSTWDASEETRALGAPIRALAATEDAIVRTPMTEGCWGEGRADLIWLDSAEHMLPETDPEWCAEHIQAFVDDLDR